MKVSRVILLAGGILLAVMVMYSISSAPDDAYFDAIQKERKSKNDFMKNSEASPFGEGRPAFDSLKYFTPDPAYKVTAHLQPIENKKVVILPTSSGEEDRYLEYARAEFELADVKCSLLILEVMASGPTRGTLFLAFADGTSTKETYGAGRYLDVKKIPGATSATLDFNKAYNPYCAYVNDFSCPLPPKENILDVRIEAGEKSYH